MLHWLDNSTFTIDGIRFTLDYEHGGSTRASDADDFTMMKSKAFLETYLKLQNQGFRKVLELGVYQGGSFVFLDKLLRPDAISAVELVGDPIPALDRYVAANKSRCHVYYGTSQDDVAALERIVETDFGGELDLVVDDASHWYELTKASFKTLFPRLKPGGTYIIEDWSWSFEPAYQDRKHPWFDQPSLANILIDLAGDLARGGSVESFNVVRDMIIVKKGANAGLMFDGKGRRERTPELL